MKNPALNRLFGASAVVTGATIALVVDTVPAQASTLPLESEASAFLNSTLPWNYDSSPPGANVQCTPSAAHPYPVVLVKGTFASMYNSFGAISPDLVNNGYCVYAFNYGQTIPLTGIYATGAHGVEREIRRHRDRGRRGSHAVHQCVPACGPERAGHHAAEPVPAGRQRSPVHRVRLERAAGHDQRPRAGLTDLPADVRGGRADLRQRLAAAARAPPGAARTAAVAAPGRS